MDHTTPADPSWEQLTLSAGEAVEITLKVGLVPEGDHCQVQVDMIDPGTGRQIALCSRPHGSIDDAEYMITWGMDELMGYVRRALMPFSDVYTDSR